MKAVSQIVLCVLNLIILKSSLFFHNILLGLGLIKVKISISRIGSNKRFIFNENEASLSISINNFILQEV